VRTDIQPSSGGRRFAAPEWQQWPFNLVHRSYLLGEQWWDEATHGVWGVEKHHPPHMGAAPAGYRVIGDAPGDYVMEK
jgi:hypothetical protein